MSMRGGQPTGPLGCPPLVLNLSRLRDADQGGELQVLMREFSALDAAPSAFYLVAETHRSGGPEGWCPFNFPSPMKRAKAGRAELLAGARQGQTGVWRRVSRLALARSKEPVELVNLLRCRGRHERIPDRIAIEGGRLSKPAWDEETDRPFIDRLEQVRVPQEEQSELGGHLPCDQVEEHVPPSAIAWRADRELAWSFPGPPRT